MRNPQLNRCGTLGGSDHSKREVKNTQPTKNYMWNTVTIQYNPLIASKPLSYNPLFILSLTGDHTVQPPHRGGVGRTLQGNTGFS